MATILVVDDRYVNRQFLVTLLGYRGHYVVEASDGAQGLELSRIVRPQLVITDIVMPTMDGLELATRLHADPELCHIPVVFYSSTYLEREARALARSANVTYVISKPADPETILRTVNDALGFPTAEAAMPGWRPSSAEKGPVAVADSSSDTAAERPPQANQAPASEIHDAGAARLESLIELGIELASQRDPLRLLETFGLAVRKIVGARIAAIGIHSGEAHLHPFFVSGIDADSMNSFEAPPSDQGIVAQVANIDAPLRLPCIPDELSGWGFDRGGTGSEDKRATAFLGAPIVAHGHRFGVLLIIGKLGVDEFGAEDARVVSLLTAQFAVAYEDARLYDEIQQRAATLEKEIDERRKVEASLRESEERFRQMAENIGQVFWMTDLETRRMLYVSPSYEEMWGRTCQSLYEAPSSYLDVVHPEDRPLVIAEKTKAGDFALEYRIVRPDGSLRWIWDRAFPVRNERGEIYRVAGIAEDITHRKRYEESLSRSQIELEARVAARTIELSQAKEEADSANAAKSEFLSRMSHELRTPLNAIIGFSQLLERRPLGERDLEEVGYILKAAYHLLELINEVLDIARFESGRIPLALEAVEIEPVVRESLDIVHPIAAGLQVQLSSDPALARRHVMADRQRFKQVLINLLANGAKYNRPGGSVHVDCVAVAGEELRIRIQDSGRGIAADDLDKLFKPFERLKAANSNVEGTGLGLSLSKLLVDAMGGRLGVESQLDKGSTFYIDLPLAEKRQTDTVKKGAGVRDGLEIQADARKTILAIEDNPLNLSLIESMLGLRPNFALLGAQLGSAGLELARTHRPDLILLDVHLPDMDGIAVLDLLQRADETAEIPVVVVTADATGPLRRRLLDAGARQFLTKPYDIEEMLGVIDEILYPRA